MKYKMISCKNLLTVLLMTFMHHGCRNSNGNTIRNSDVSISCNEIPVLCYHQVRDWKATDSKTARTYILPVNAFKEQIRVLHDSGYNAILPDQLVAYIKNNVPLPNRPILLTFDDATESQYINALPELEKVGFKGIFFIMTVSLDHSPFMTRKEVAEISSRGHIIGCHTWDHRSVTMYKEHDWVTEVKNAQQELEKITGKEVKYFAYPFGIWNEVAVTKLKQYGFTAAFQLWGKYGEGEQLYTIRRILVNGTWRAEEMLHAIHRSEKRKHEL